MLIYIFIYFFFFEQSKCVPATCWLRGKKIIESVRSTEVIFFFIESEALGDTLIPQQKEKEEKDKNFKRNTK